MDNIAKRNKKVVRLTESELREIISKSTASILNEGGGRLIAKIGRGLANLAKKKMIRKVYKGQKMAHKGIDYASQAAKKHRPSPKYMYALTKVKTPEFVRAWLKCAPRESETLYDAYKFIYENRQLWNRPIPNLGMTYSEYMNKITDTLAGIYHDKVDNFVRMVESGMNKSIIPPEYYDKACYYISELFKLAVAAVTIMGSWVIYKSVNRTDQRYKQQQVNNNHKFPNR